MSVPDDKQLWIEIPEEYERRWRDVFTKSKEGINLSAPCPVCGHRTLHRYYQIGQIANIAIDGNKFIGRGDLWEWSSSCRSYGRYFTAVPDWWTCDISVNDSELTDTPEVLEEAIATGHPQL